jgi:hypothetical protein
MEERGTSRSGAHHSEIQQELQKALEQETGDEAAAQGSMNTEQYQHISQTMKRMERTIEILAKEVHDTGETVKLLLLRLSSSTARAHTGAQDYAKASHLLLVGNYFTTEFIQQVVSYNIPDFSFRFASKSTDGSRTAIPGNIIRVMMYAVKPFQKKIPNHRDVDFRKEEDHIHNMNESMRAVIVKNLALNVAHHSGVERSERAFQKNTPRAFMNTEQGNLEESSQNVSSAQPHHSQPTSLLAAHSVPSVSWLTSGFFKQKHFESSASTDEVFASSGRLTGSRIQANTDSLNEEGSSHQAKVYSGRKKRKVREDSDFNTDDIAFLVIKDVRERLNTFLNKCRDAARRRFVEDLGFVLQDVEDLYGITSDVFKGLEPVLGDYTKQPEEEDLHLIPESILHSNDLYSVQSSEEKNDALYAKLLGLGRLSGMQFNAKYTVLVEDQPEQLQERELKRVIDLIDVSLNFCVAYFLSRDRHHFFSYSTHSMRLVYLVAIGLRSIARRAEGSSGTLACLLPGKNVYNSIVEAGVMKMKLEKYNRLNTMITEQSSNTEEEDVENVLTEDAESGLMLLPFTSFSR